MSFRLLLRILATAVGLGLIGAAIFAPQLGLDSNTDWGPSRKLLVVVGVLVIAVGWSDRLGRLFKRAGNAVGDFGARLAGRVAERAGVSHLYRRLASRWRESAAGRKVAVLRSAAQRTWQSWLSRSRLLRWFFGTRPAQVRTAAWSAFVVVAASYLWLVSVGGWARWPGTSAYYDLQAEAFAAGQTHLLAEPEADLLALPNPYDPEARASISYLWDASLYRGRFYLYWGPVPALMIVPIRALLDRHVGDDALVLFFSVGVLFWCTRLILRLWRDHFGEVPGWLVPAAVLTIGWANPAPWMLNSPWVYEAAIVGGQFFFVMALYAMLPFWTSDDGRAANLAWAGVSFALAAGTRVSLVPAIAAVTTVLLLRLWLRRSASNRARSISSLAAFGVPLLVGAAALAGYNQVRFDSPLELGHRYQLTSLDLMRADIKPTSPANIPPNLYNYLVNPVRFLRVFPYIKPYWGGRGMSALRIPVPAGYYSRQVAGQLLVAPFLLFAIQPALRMWRRYRWRGGRAGDASAASNATDPLTWLTIALLAAGAAQFLMVQAYIVSTMRYQADFTPVWMLLATIGLWEVLAAQHRSGRPLGAISIAALALMTWTAVAGMLLGVTGQFARFENANPELFRRLTEFFTP